jgi:glyoxylase-like metal-dependent hydrolase (beta-lactamase superfamily II)
MAMNEAVDWSRDLGGGVRVGLIQAGTFRSDAGTLFGPVPWVLWGKLVEGEVDDKRRLLQALNCLLIETKSGRVLVETGIGERVDEKTRDQRDYQGPPIAAALETAGFPPESINVVAMSHLHFDHAGGLLRADGSHAFPNAKIVAQKAEWEVALGDNPRLVASYVQPELRLVETWGKQGWADGEHEIMPGVTVVPTGGHSTGHQAVVVRSGEGGQTLAFFGDLLMRTWAANPRWVTSFDDFPLDSVVRKAELFAQAVDEDWIVVLSHEAKHPIGRLVRDRDRFKFEAG